MTVKLCAVVPSHNHYLVIEEVVKGLRASSLPVFILDDGSSEPTKSTLAQLHDPNNKIFVTRFDQNRGKGCAVIEAFRIAKAAGYTHAVQVDADGQHDVEALPRLLGLAKDHPEALVSGQPIYDETIPKSRKIARWITHFWVWIETLSFQISDSMCGYRVYPLAESLNVADEETVGQRMDFDTEIMVRLFWRGTPTIMTPVKVTYPENNTSNFDVVADNVRITKMHTRLVFNMLFRLPSVLKNRPKKPKIASKWATIDERGMAWGLKFLATTYKLLGYRVCWVVMQPILFYFFVTGSVQRKASRQYWEKIYAAEGRVEKPGLLQLWSHTRSFGRMALDKFSAWMGDVTESDLIIPNEEELEAVIAQDKGVLVFASHLGNIEICRALSKSRNDVKITVFAHTKHAVKFNELLSAYNPDAAMDVVEVTDMGPSTAIDLQERLDAGEWVVIAGDRTPVDGDKRLSYVPFLGKDAPFSQGPMILAALLKCQVYSMICMKEDDKYRVFFEKLSDQVTLPRKTRKEALDQEIGQYARLLERHCKKYPHQWYNFFDFWAEGQ
ncbi:glycosyltransferase [Terasakiella sp. A23]|uniref:glycosyltransferase family 2 protein n=1 Tax=Terasakiella sp. FCG-A23 TaxID=3080561 RepID=UPI002955DAC7|nr:glycosyltransferase [Terasakiella sp. A23]MDV7341026.1 glycosyltransferase [Terasakiella sp. A23]